MSKNQSVLPLQNYREINQKWLEEMLSQKYESPVTVHSWSSTLPRGREGFLSEIAFVRVKHSIKCNNEIETQLVFKFLPEDPSLVKFLSNGGLAKREVEFYQFVNSSEFKDICSKNNVNIPVPEAFYASYTEDAITIVLRNLSVDKYKSVIIRDGSTLSQTKTALHSIALIHAAGILYLQKYGQSDGLASLAAEFNTDFYDQFFLPNLKKLEEMYKGTSLCKVFRDFIPLTKHIRSTSRRNPLINTVIHGDLWAGQLLYSDDETLASVIDWQFCHIDNPVSDIMSMFFMSSDPKILEENLDDILESYWDTLSNTVQAGGGSLDITLEELMANVNDMWMYGFMFLTVSIHDFLNGDNISDERLKGVYRFLEKKGVFKRFLAEFGSPENNQ